MADERNDVNTAWLAVDWGTSNLRVWAMADDGSVLDAMTSDRGMSGLTSDQYEDVLVKLAGSHIQSAAAHTPLPVIICGMAGSRSGWSDAGYIDAPVHVGALSGSGVSVSTKDERIAVRILPGLRQMDPPDVMRGEETQLAGFAASHPTFRGQVCLPGTHSKWVRFENGHISQCQTVMTGEFFALLAEQSILSHSIASLGDISGDLPKGAFLEGVELGYESAGGAFAHLFALRAGDLVGDDRNGTQRLALLSGLLVGSEFAAVGPNSAAPIMVIGSQKLGSLYQRAAAHLGFEADFLSGADLVLTGLSQARDKFQPSGSQMPEAMVEVTEGEAS
ncbi:MAG: 2-dehydro-3-deoxygalactonokinase [Pseudomonadota bacterium]